MLPNARPAISTAPPVAWRFGERRRPGQAKIRVHNPDPAADGWSSPHTIVEIVNDDMPFLVDSVTGAINASSRVVHLIIHPILTVARGPDGRLCDILEPGAPGTRESWMQIEITSEADPADPARLTQTLSGVLADVRAAVTDWQPMRQVLREVAAELSARPPPVPAAELSEAQDFLKWLDDDNFTFLGYREYFFDGSAKPEHGPLGILRDEAHSVFGGLRTSPLYLPMFRISSAAANAGHHQIKPPRGRFTGPLTWMRSECGGAGRTVTSPVFASSSASLRPSPTAEFPLDPTAAAQGSKDRRALRSVAREPRRQVSVAYPRHVSTRRTVPGR